MSLRQLLHQLAYRVRPTGNGAEEAHFLARATLCNRHRYRLLARIEGHVCRILFHGSSPMLEALTGVPDQPSILACRETSHRALFMDMGSQ
jgi:hypothetical protein